MQRDLNEELSFGGEIYRQGATSNSNKASTLVNFGGNYYFTEHIILLFSGGHNVMGAKNTIAYLGVDIIW